MVKMARTQLQDAVPMTLVHEINLGATAIGTSFNAPAGYTGAACRHLVELTGLPLSMRHLEAACLILVRNCVSGIAELVLEQNLLNRTELDELLRPARLANLSDQAPGAPISSARLRVPPTTPLAPSLPPTQGHKRMTPKTKLPGQHPDRPHVSANALSVGDGDCRKSLKNRQIQMFAIGGAIGTGLFMGAGDVWPMPAPAWSSRSRSAASSPF